MRYFKLLFNNLNPYLADMTQLRIQYNDQCQPIWQLLTYDISCLFNVYPKEWMVTEASTDVLYKYDLAKLRSIEPWWKLVASNKGMLPLLYTMFPNHPSIIPAYFDNPQSEIQGINAQAWSDILYQRKWKNWVSKPVFGREGAGVYMSWNYTSWNSFLYSS